MHLWFLSRQIWPNFLAQGLRKLQHGTTGIFKGVFFSPEDMPPSRVGVQGPWAYHNVIWIWTYTKSGEEVRDCSRGPFRGFPPLIECYVWLLVFLESWPGQTDPRCWDQADCWNLALGQCNNTVASIYRLLLFFPC